jgi:hypothetical protein
MQSHVDWSIQLGIQESWCSSICVFFMCIGILATRAPAALGTYDLYSHSHRHHHGISHHGKFSRQITCVASTSANRYSVDIMNPRNESPVFSRDAWWVSQERNDIGHFGKWDVSISFSEMRPAGFYLCKALSKYSRKIWGLYTYLNFVAFDLGLFDRWGVFIFKVWVLLGFLQVFEVIPGIFGTTPNFVLPFVQIVWKS